MSYSETVFLPQTSFPMKASLTATEPRLLQKWKEANLYSQMVARAEKSGKAPFTIADGPPYANGPIHVGHVLNKILKDIAVKYWNMNGHPSRFVPGWDCHGLPIELKALSKKPDNLREACQKEALKWIGHQKDQFMRLGVLADWDKPYLTLTPKYQAAELRLLAKISEQGRLVRGLKPVYWCPKLGTAFAAAEVEYAEIESPSVYVKFKLSHADTYLVIWTTTPWTLPANEAVCLNANLSYTTYRVKYNGVEEHWIIGSAVAALFFSDLGIQDYEEVSYLNGPYPYLNDKTVDHPLYQKKVPIIFGSHVASCHTGCVHTAPGHGLDDYKVGLQYNLPITCVVGPYGKMVNAPGFDGLTITEASNKICDILKQKGLLFEEPNFKHFYPHNPRTNTPLIYRATPQWFVKYDDALRQTAQEAVERLSFVPEVGRNRLAASTANAPDWCVSRQRTWGVPIPALMCESCDESYVFPEMIESLASAVEQCNQSAADLWPTIAASYVKVCKCGKALSKTEPVILDVWFDSGVYHEAVGGADVYLEGSDQHRGWFQTSLMSALAASKPAPFQKVVTHGFVVDEQGRKMAKSLGNVVDPETVINKYGAEILRLWVMSEDFTKDVTLGPAHFERFADSYRKFRNTFRFLMGALADFRPELCIDAAGLSALDRWMLHQLNTLIRESHESYRNFKFHELYHRLMNFFSTDLSSFYFDIVKGCLYTFGRDWPSRRSVQTVMWHLVDVLHRLMAPCLSFLAEEVAETMGWESPFLRDFPGAQVSWDDGSLDTLVREAVEIRNKVYKNLDAMRAKHEIGSSLEAQVELDLDVRFKDLWIDWAQFLIVSRADVWYGDAIETEIKVIKCDSPKCERCWIRTYNRSGNICNRCHSALSSVGK